jgi:hypothetical protein
MRARFECAPFFLLCIWIIPQIDGTGLVIVTLFGMVLQFYIRDIYWYAIGEVGKVFDEMAADNFALVNLNHQDLMEVASLFRESPPGRDSTLNAEGDERRRAILLSNLGRAYEQGGKLETLEAVPQPSHTLVPMWVCFGIAAVLATMTNTATIGAFWALALLTVTLVPCLVFCRTRQKRLEKWIDLLLAGPEAIPAERLDQWPEESGWLVKARVFCGVEPRRISSASG